MQAMSYTRGYVQVDLDKMLQNIENMKQNMQADAKMMLIIKADGYGHGALPIAKAYEALPYLWGYGVATLDEGIILRNAGITKPILVLGCVFPNQYAELLQYDIKLNVYTLEMACELAQLAAMTQKKIGVHIKIDSGMSRLGFLPNAEGVEMIEQIAKLPGIEIEGIFTHFSKADEEDKTYTHFQYEQFQFVIEALATKGISIPVKHCCNSAGIIDFPDYNLDLVRAGISLYGLYPSDEVQEEAVPLQPVLSFHSTIASIKELEAGTCISYGGTYQTKQKIRVGVVPIGYADGYPRGLSNQGYVLVEGKVAPILGRICMDQFMIDLTEIPEAKFMTPVTLIGENQGKIITVEELGTIANKFNYEFVCGISKRIPRIYIKDQKIEDQIDYFA